MGLAESTRTAKFSSLESVISNGTLFYDGVPK